MSQFNLVLQPSGSPSCCLACGGAVGPFIDLQLPFVKVPTAIGVLDSEGPVHLCVGTVENPGCVVQMGRMSGLMVDVSTLAELQEHVRELNAEIAELHATLAKKTLKVEDVIQSMQLKKEVAV